MELHRPATHLDLKVEYGLRGARLLPWQGLDLPFGGAYCVVDPHTETLRHVNEPSDEEELFICIEGQADIVVGEEHFTARTGDLFVMPRGVPHHVHNNTDAVFRFYAIWWNQGTATQYLAAPRSTVDSAE